MICSFRGRSRGVVRFPLKRGLELKGLVGVASTRSLKVCDSPIGYNNKASS
jgi:hypothetical protein